MAEDRGREAGVDDRVEVSGYGVQGDEVVDAQLACEVEAEFRVEEDAVEDVESWVVGADVNEWLWGEDYAGTFSLSRSGEEGVRDAVWGCVEVRGHCGLTQEWMWAWPAVGCSCGVEGEIGNSSAI